MHLHLFKAAVDGVHIVGQLRRDHAGVDRREAAADIDHVREHAGADQGAGGLRHRRLEGRGAHALRPDVEGHAHQLVGRPASGEQQARRLMHIDAELAGQRIGRPLGRDAEAHDEVQVPRTAGRLEDLGQLFMGVEREGLHAVVGIGPRDRSAALHRMHEGHGRPGGGLRHQVDLVQRSDVETARARLPQSLDDPRGWIGLYRVKDVAFEVVLEPACR